MEELDLLTKWLGPDSKEFAISMRATNIANPGRALQLIWIRLEQMYGRAETKERELSDKVAAFPVLTDSHADRIKYLRLVDLLCEIESVMNDERYANLLSYFNSSKGVLPITQKLPRSISEKWAIRASQYKTRNKVPYPPFSFFVQFMREVSERKNDPSFYSADAETKSLVKTEPRQRLIRNLNARKVNIDSGDMLQPEGSDISSAKRCPIHKAPHALTACRSFNAMTLNQKRDYLKSNNLCFKCCNGKHLANKCHSNVKCEKCSSNRHITCMHYEPEIRQQQGGEEAIVTKCSELCGNISGGRSCGKVVLVDVYPKDNSECAVRMYAVVDDQSNKTLARSKFFDVFNVKSDTSVFTMASCSGTVSYSGRSAGNFIVKPVIGETELRLPDIIECDDIPDNITEIPTPDVALAYPHLNEIAQFVPELDPSSEILLLIGRDVPQAHHVIDQKTGSWNEPFAQKLYLGWTIIGEVCLGGVHRPNHIDVRRTHVLGNGRSSLCEPCDGQLTVHREKQLDRIADFVTEGIDSNSACNICDIFKRTEGDETPGLSIEDKIFVSLMQGQMKREDGRWTAPLPFRENRVSLPNNRSQALRRAIVLDNSFKRDPLKRDHAFEFMGKVLLSGHAEPAPPLEPDKECWYLPVFGVYHPQRPDKIRMVFDSSAKFQDVSLNSVLLSGPDFTNSLIGVLMKFRLNKVAITADIEQMFYCFRVTPDHRDFLRFLWYSENDPEKALVDHRMCAHVFGNTPSPAIANYGLRRTAAEAVDSFGQDVRNFIDKHFYVDDGLISLPSTNEAIDLLQRTRDALLTHGHMRLHKIASNDPVVMQAFKPEELAKDLINLDFGMQDLPVQRSLGLVWDLAKDSFIFQLNADEKPFTRRGVLSVINSLYDPLGFVAPVIVQGKIILREMMFESSINWDDPLPDVYLLRWTNWRQALLHLQDIAIPRQYLPNLETASRSIVVFTDASESAIAAVAYLCGRDCNDKLHLGFIMGKSKVAPRQATSIPRLELCAAVLGVEIARIVKDHLNISTKDFYFYTDSMIVLGYISNKTRRFLTYVGNRVHRILCFSTSEQWRFVPTDVNPADHGTRLTSDHVVNNKWLHGPVQWLGEQNDSFDNELPVFELVNPEEDVEIKKSLIVNKVVTSAVFSTKRYENFSTWRSLIRALAFLKLKCRKTKDNQYDPKLAQTNLYSETENFVIGSVQTEVFHREIKCLREEKPLPKDSRILKLDPWLDPEGILRVGGRLNKADISLQEKNPILIPGFHHIARLLVHHHHELVQHQGRHLTEGAIRASGLWITGSKRLVYSVISSCVKCRRSRGSFSQQKMCDLPVERLTPSPPFTYVGVDCFGPWEIVTRRTRGGSANSKRWAALFTCMCSRAIHVEVLEDMSTSCFVNALRRFMSIRGKVKKFYSDRGSNFVGCVRELGITGVNVEEPQIKDYLQRNGTVWNFNTPYSSHMGGAWERLIGIMRRILDSLLLDVRHTKLTHEVLTTFLAEACAIVNNRPLTTVSSDPNSPFVLTPNILLTQKTGDITDTPMELDVKSFYTSQWKVVQALAERFWKQWRHDYLHSLQQRRKWEKETPNLNVGDIVLMKDSETKRNYWPLGRISRVFPSEDDLIRKVELFVIKNGTKQHYVRPITQIVPLLSVV